MLKKRPSLHRKLELYGESYLTDEELWSLFWENGRQSLCVAKLELERCGGMKAFLSPFLKGSALEAKFSKKKFLQWRIFEEFRKRGSKLGKKLVLNSPDKIFDLVKEDFYKENLEICVVVGRNRQKECMFVQKISVGDTQKVFCRMRDVFKAPLFHDVEGFALIHNHLSGPLAPSKEDLITTKMIEKVSAFLEIEMIDHLIVHQEDFLSLYKLGYLRQRENY